MYGQIVVAEYYHNQNKMILLATPPYFALSRTEGLIFWYEI